MTIPNELDSTASPRSITIGALVCLAVVLVCNHVYSDYLEETELSLTTSKWNLVAKQSPKDWVFVGDSSCNQGLDPSLWQAKTGESAVNLCTVAAIGLVDDVWLLNEWTRVHGAPKGVVVMHAPHAYASRPVRSIVAEYPKPWGYWSQMDPPLSMGPGELWDVFLVRHVPLIGRTRVLSMKERVVELRSPPKRGVKMGAEIDDAGFLRWEHADPAAMENSVSLRKAAYEKGFTLPHDNAAALDSLVEYSKKHDVPIHLVKAPLSTRLTELESFKTYNDALDAQLTKLSSGRIVFHTELLTDPEDQHFHTADHLTYIAVPAYVDWVLAATKLLD